MPNNSSGCCIFAYNTNEINYFNQALEAANRVSKYLNLPVTIFTNENKSCNHNVIVTDVPEINYKLRSSWFNRNRTKAFELSPYEKTLLIDSDYYINTDTLSFHLKSIKPFLIAKEVYNPKKGIKQTFNLGRSHIPMLWATVMIFDKSDEARSIFECAKLVEKHYEYYSLYYKFKPYPIRNDYIFSIACHLMGGYGCTSYEIKNYPIVNCDLEIYYEKLLDNKLVYKYENVKIYANRLQNIDLHLLNKDQL